MQRVTQTTVTPLSCCMLCSCLLFLAAWLSHAQQTDSPDNGRRIMTAAGLAEGESIRLDGILDEAAWSRAIPAADFLQKDPLNGAPASERTEVRILFDRHTLYLGIICFDTEPDRLLGKQLQRDQDLAGDDRFMWTMDPYRNGRTGYYFETNPAGLLGDGLIAQNSSGAAIADKSWDGIWNLRVRKSEIGWTVEVEIPFRTLNFDPSATAWSINFQRTVRRKNEEALWTGHARNQSLLQMSNAGLLQGLEEISQGVGLDFKPYVVGRIREAPGEGQPYAVRTGDVGADFFYNVTPALRANFTVNTDFAETEVDQRVVNLTRFPVRFPEKRDFFLEGSTVFDFASRGVGDPFFSRRIGLNARGEPQSIVYGTKLTGQVSHYDVGLLQVRTAAEGEFAAEDFTVVRTKRRLFEQSMVGMIYTHRSGQQESVHGQHLLGVDVDLYTSRFRGSQNLHFRSFYVWHTSPLDTGGTKSFGARIHYPNDLWTATFSARELQEHYNPAIGFTQRANHRRYSPAITFSPRPRDHRWIRQLSFGMPDLELITDLQNRTLTRDFHFRPMQVSFHSGDTVTFAIFPTFDRLDRDFPIHEGITLTNGSEYQFTRYRFSASTASRRWLSLTPVFERGTFYSGDRRELSLDLSLRPRRALLFNLYGEWNRVELKEGSFSTNLLRGSVSQQFGPWISLVNHLQYDSVTRTLGWQSRMRWIIRPGDDVYLVYTHNWLEELSDFATRNRQLAAKLFYTHRF